MRLQWYLTAALAGVLCMVQGGAAFADGFEGIDARISAPLANIHPGKPVPVQFTLHNGNDHPVVLSTPNTQSKPPMEVGGLPIEHVFSGLGFGGLTIRGDYDRVWNEAFGYSPPAESPELILGPRAIVGTEIDIAQFYPALHSPGRYRLVWQPYGGLLTSNELIIEVAPLKQALLLTDDGTMTIQFFYELAPKHVANFLELARNGFYNQKIFHRIESGYFIQGGCPNGDGSGIRPDGKKLEAEFNAYPIDRGTVCMARLENDPDSASCQFMISNTRLPSWDGRYTVFGHLVGEESLKTLDNLMMRDVDKDTGRPERTVYIRAVRLTDAPAPEENPRPTIQPLQEVHQLHEPERIDHMHETPQVHEPEYIEPIQMQEVQQMTEVDPG